MRKILNNSAKHKTHTHRERRKQWRGRCL